MKGHKNLHLMANGMAGLLSCLLLFSCNNEDYPIENESGKVCENICFGISSDESNRTRGISGIDNENGRTVSRFVLRSENSADTLCVRASVSDGIVSSSALTDDKAVTRGAPVTALDEFKVLAYWEKGGTLQDQFFMDETASRNGDVWTTGHTYYWPGAAHTFQFYAYAPADAGFTAPSTSASTTLADYTVPAEVTEQSDIVVANTDEILGDNNRQVPLQFKHICTAVRFVVGSEMQPGSITGITLKGVKGSGSYNMATSQWTLGDATMDFSQNPNKTTDGNTATGDEITSAAGTFMMLPQTLAAGASVEIVFQDDMSSQPRTLTASIAGQEWPMGKTVTYKLSITPEYELEFLEIPSEMDAHYDIIPIKVKAKDVKGNWSIKSDQSWVTIKSNLTSYEKSGYWLKNVGDYSKYCASENIAVERQQTLSTATEGDEVMLYLFVAENNSTSNRKVTLTLTKDGAPANASPAASIEVVQKCPVWQGNIGWEVIEEDIKLPYGFKWDRKVTLTKTLTGSWLAKNIEEWLTKQAFKVQPDGWWAWIESLLWPTLVDYVKISRSGDTMTVIIDYSRITNITTAMSTTDGQANTWNLYTNVGGTSFNGEQDLLDSGYTIVSETGTLENTKDFAALYAIKLNAFAIYEGGSGDQITYAIIPEQTDINWYLPASGQFNMELDGQYWSSTAINDNANAYSWNTSATSTPRMNLHKVRAVRKQ